MKNIKRTITMLIAVVMIAGLMATPAFAANNNQATLHAAANVLRDDLGYPNDHACVRAMSATWNVEDGKSVGDSYYYSSRLNAYYYFGKNNSTNALFTGNYNSANRRQQAAASVVNSLVAIYGNTHPTVAAASDILAAECGTSASLGYFFSATEGKYYYFSGSYEQGNTSSNGKDDGSQNNTTKQPGQANNNNNSNNGNGNTGNGNTSSGTPSGTNPNPSGNYALYAAQDYFSGCFTGTENYIDATRAPYVAKFIASYCGSNNGFTYQAALGWTVVNYMVGRQWSDATIKAAYPDYNSGAAYTADQLALAKDILFRREAERAGVANVGRVLPADYARMWITYDGDIYFRNQEGENAPNWNFSLKSPYNS